MSDFTARDATEHSTAMAERITARFGDAMALAQAWQERAERAEAEVVRLTAERDSWKRRATRAEMPGGDLW